MHAFFPVIYHQVFVVQVFNRFASEQEAQDGAAHTWTGAGPRHGHNDQIAATTASFADVELEVRPQIISEAIIRSTAGNSIKNASATVV